MKTNFFKGKLKWVCLLIGLAFMVWYALSLPKVLFNDPTSTVLLDKDGILLGAKIAGDGQWRISAGDSVPVKFETCILQFEDRGFYHHAGISIKAIGRALIKNITHKKIVSGGSTITMQLARIMRKNPPRAISEKLIEMVLATRLEIRYSKKEILGYYANHAPFGNNVVGLEAASWRYFGRSCHQLSWAENATLAVLPNAPGLIYPGKNHQKLIEKRNRLLKRLYDTGSIDATTFELALAEPLPDKPLPLPQLAQHLLSRLVKNGYQGGTIKSSVSANLQQRALQLLQQHSLQLQQNKIFNGAVLITDLKTGKVLVYIGNTVSPANEHANKVDCIAAARSTGSILKPVLYARAMEAGIINPGTLLLDVPTYFGNFSPRNFNGQYDGAVPANAALAKSLNIPFVRLLNEYGLEKFHNDLKKWGLTTIHKPASYYGLSLILGGAEANLWDLNLAFSSMAQELISARVPGVHLTSETNTSDQKGPSKITDAACIYSMLEAMVEVNRPDEDGNWRAFSGSQKIAWKTGTSFGFRDAWAIGITPNYVVSVWVGNANGEGRPGLTGIKAAAPLLFDLFGQLPRSTHWFKKPANQMEEVPLCRESGYREGEFCDHIVNTQVPKTCLLTSACPYHRLIHLNKKLHKRVDSDCERPSQMVHVPWFVLPPVAEKFYQANHPAYKILPEFKTECFSKISDKPFAILYPKPNSKIYVPLEIDGQRGRAIFEATHRNSQLKIYWHLDDEYLGETREIHQLALNPALGKHRLLLIDENGVSSALSFEVIGR